MAWVDNLVIPRGARNLDNAKAFIAFLSQPENAALTQNFLKHQSPVRGVEPFLEPGLKDAPGCTSPKAPRWCSARPAVPVPSAWPIACGPA